MHTRAQEPGESQITPDSVTGHARRLVLAGDWQQGLAYLKSAARIAGRQASLDILSGKSRLVAAAGNQFLIAAELPEVCAAFQASCESVFNAGCLMHEGRRYKVRGFVREASSEIMEKAAYDIQDGRARYTQLMREIGVHYMQHKRTEHAFIVVHPTSGRSVCALFAPDTDPIERPEWLAAPGTDPQRAVETEGILPNLGELSDDEDASLSFEPVSAADRIAAGSKPKKERDPTSPDAYDKLRQSFAESKALELGANLEELTRSLREKILQQLAARGVDEWKVFEIDAPHVGGKRTLSYPPVIGLAYALSATNDAACAPNWEAVSPPGLKMDNDNPLHTDLWLSVGFDLNWTAYGVNHPDNNLFQALVAHLQQTALGYQLHVLTAARQKAVSGTVRTAEDFNARVKGESTILLVPHAGEEFHAMAMASQGVICQQGGKLAHLAIVGREMGIPIVRIDGAMSKFKSGAAVIIDLVNGKVDVVKSPGTK
ncbi:hypothetical protein BH11PSE11_BH11PSE11_31160 [soil metagenome]